MLINFIFSSLVPSAVLIVYYLKDIALRSPEFLGQNTEEFIFTNDLLILIILF